MAKIHRMVCVSCVTKDDKRREDAGVVEFEEWSLEKSQCPVCRRWWEAYWYEVVDFTMMEVNNNA